MMKYFFIVCCIAVGLFITHPVSALVIPPGEGRKENVMVERKVKTRAALQNANVVSKGTDSLTVKGEDGKEYKVMVDGSTQWRRKFWGKSDLAETSVNDILNIHGKWIDEQETQIQARLIRNISIQKRHGVFFGTVKSVTSTGWVMTTAKRGDQTVTISGNTRLIDRKETTLSQSAIVVGHRVRIKGVWDSQNNTITEVTQVKDFDLPVKSTPTPTQ